MTTRPSPVRPGTSASGLLTALGALVAPAVLALAACSSAQGAPPTPAASPVPPAPVPAAAPGTPGPAANDAAGAGAPLAFGATHVFADGNAVSLSAPDAAPPVAGAPFPRALDVTVTIRNGTPAAEDLSRFGFDATVPGTPAAREAPAVDDGPSGLLAPGEERTFPMRFGLPDPGPTQVTVEVAKTDQTAPGQDVPGSDGAPGASVDFTGQV